MYVLITHDSVLGRLVFAQSGQWKYWGEGYPVPVEAERFANYATGRAYLQRIQEGLLPLCWVAEDDSDTGIVNVGVSESFIASQTVRPCALQYRYAA